MRILHCCLAAFYIDNFSYQENILPKIHKINGLQVNILASTETYLDNIKLGYIKPGTYINENGIEVTRIPYINWLPAILRTKLRIYNGIRKVLENFKPEIIFLHDCQFLSIIEIAKYAKKNNVRIYVDSHTDYINSGRNWLSKNILHRIIFRYCAKQIEQHVTWFYGTLPLRNDFLHTEYGVDRDKIKLLPFGADDTLFNRFDKQKIRNQIRRELNFSDNEIIIITGGKIDERKKIHILLSAFDKFTIKNPEAKFKLLIFGKPNSEMDNIFDYYINNSKIIHLDWLNAQNIYKYFLSADLAFFPGTHSVLWEEAIGLGLPCIFKRWEGIEHVDLGGNCIFLDNAEEEIIINILDDISDGNINLSTMKQVAENLGVRTFSYSRIAKTAIEEI
ncbi:MAG: glycosyltransferase family 4 protein [Deltaproteobacteria bacterium]